MTTLHDDKNNPSYFSRIVREGVIWSFIGAAIGAVASLIPGLNKIYNRGFINETVQGAAIGAVVGVAAETVTGAFRDAHREGSKDPMRFVEKLDQKQSCCDAAPLGRG